VARPPQISGQILLHFEAGVIRPDCNPHKTKYGRDKPKLSRGRLILSI
jgi:hypothetical protein